MKNIKFSLVVLNIFFVIFVFECESTYLYYININFIFQLFEYEEHPTKLPMPDDSDIDDDLSECFDDHNETTDDEDEQDVDTARKTLEWDDSNLSY